MSSCNTSPGTGPMVGRGERPVSSFTMIGWWGPSCIYSLQLCHTDKVHFGAPRILVSGSHITRGWETFSHKSLRSGQIHVSGSIGACNCLVSGTDRPPRAGLHLCTRITVLYCHSVYRRGVQNSVQFGVLEYIHGDGYSAEFVYRRGVMYCGCDAVH